MTASNSLAVDVGEEIRTSGAKLAVDVGEDLEEST